MELQKTEKIAQKWISDRTIANRYEIARSTVWAWTRKGKLPKPVKLGENITRWNEDEIERFMQSLLNK
ncbi:AlpA family phage regulatory protein [Gammaproteobacteria bacterium]|nr:AlpA family phage regulatory protein [Gammaproteobacteria bacterium]